MACFKKHLKQAIKSFLETHDSTLYSGYSSIPARYLAIFFFSLKS